MLSGKIMSLDPKSNTGVIRDVRGKDFLFYFAECENDTPPPVHSLVTFERDEDFQIEVACVVRLKELPRKV